MADDTKIGGFPSYMKSISPPRSPPGSHHIGIGLGLQMRSNTKMLVNEAGNTFSLDFEPRIIADSVDAVCQLAIAGLGLATPPAWLVADDIQQGRLIEPLPNWAAESLPV